MIYRDFKGEKLSALGFGTMRLPIIGENFAEIDQEKFEEMVDYAISHGVNYFDTAYPYHEKQSEIAVGKALKKYPRESFNLATKFPTFSPHYFDNYKEVFQKQLDKCQVEYFDFYLIHNVNEGNYNTLLERKEVIDYLKQMRDEGKIRHLGFSCHAQQEYLEKFLDVYGEDMEFCQLQLNWLDWELQGCREKVEVLKKHNIPVWVMEPVRGGKLINLEPQYEEMLKAAEPEFDNAEWGFRFIQSVPEVVMCLSGMSNMEQMEENIHLFEEDKPLSEENLGVLAKVSEAIRSVGTLPCTGCRYCTDYCPMSLNIPEMIRMYNQFTVSKIWWQAASYFDIKPDEEKPSACIGCGSCAAVCPQQIDIPAMMSDFAEKITKK